jgi:archaellum component FlaC
MPENPTPEELDKLQKDYLKYDWDFTNKIENTIKFIKNLESDTNALDFEIDRLEKKKKPIINKINRLKEYIDSAMSMVWYEKLTTTLAKVTYRKSESIHIEDEDLVPEEFKTQVTSTKISKSEIKKALKTWEVLWVRLITKQNLQIK